MPNQQELLELAEVVEDVLNEAEGSIINPAGDVAAQAAIIFKRADKKLKPVSNDLSIAGLGVELAVLSIGFLLAAAILWNGLREGGELRPISKNKLKIGSAVAKFVGSIVALGLGVAAFFVEPGMAAILALVTSGVGLAVSIPQFINELRKGGEFWPPHKNKLKISGAVAMILGSGLVLGLGAAALAIPGVAPILGTIAAGVGITVSVHQLFIAIREYIKAKLDLKELDVLKLKSSSPDEQLTNEQQKRLNYLQSKHTGLIEESNHKKLRDVIIQGIAIAGGTITTIGLVVSLFFPLAGLAFAVVGAAVTATCGITKLGCIIYDHVQKKRALSVDVEQTTQSVTDASKQSSIVASKESPKAASKELPIAASKELPTVASEYSLRFFTPNTSVQTDSSDDLKSQKSPTTGNP